MKITDILSKDCILDDLKSKSKKDVIVEMVGIMKSLKKIDDSDQVVKVLMEREALGSTGIGYGVAIPHAKLEETQALVAMFGRSKQGVEFDSLDGVPVKLFFLLLTPKDSTGQHLKSLARISSLLKDKLFRQELLEADGADNLYKILEREDNARG
jgi:PTS system nitrogen regulatory IIA component